MERQARQRWLKAKAKVATRTSVEYEMKSVTLLSIALAMLGGTALASDEFVYDVSQEACQQDLSETRVALSGSKIAFFVSLCDIVGEEAGTDGARMLALQCYGEGEEWSAEATLTPQDSGGIEIKLDEYAQTYVSCD